MNQILKELFTPYGIMVISAVCGLICIIIDLIDDNFNNLRFN